MPGSNCAIYGCFTSSKNKGISLFKVPGGEDDFNKNWRKKLVDIVTKDRVIDASLKNQIEKKTLRICQLHFSPDQILHHETRTTLLPNAVPTQNLPKKSIQTSSSLSQPRASASKVIEKKENALATQILNPEIKGPVYKSYENFIQRINSLKLSEGWKIMQYPNDSFISINFYDTGYLIPKFEIHVNKNLSFLVRVFSWLLPKNHSIYTENESSLNNISLSSIIKIITNQHICKGLTSSSNNTINHSLPLTVNFETLSQKMPVNQKVYYRVNSCFILITSDDCCSECKNVISKEKKAEKRKIVNISTPAKLNAPLTKTSAEKLKILVQNLRAENKTLKTDNEKLKEEIEKSSKKISPALRSDLDSIMKNADQSKLSPFMKLFWEEQQNYVKTSKHGIRYHPMIIRACLTIASKSASAYDEMRYDENKGTGFLILPSRRRLRDYKNYIKPKRGFNPEIIKELRHKIKNFSPIERFSVILFDEMKVQENLVWCKHSGELIGFVDLGDEILNSATIDKTDEIASHILVFLIRSIVNPFKFSLANFATTGARCFQIFPLLWKAVKICEDSGLNIVATTCDGASFNRAFFRMHHSMIDEVDLNPDVDVTYRVRNFFNNERPFLYFLSDPPHLIKTARNSLANSGAGRCTRYLWNDGQYLLWNHISQLFYEDVECGLKLLPKLTVNHIKLSSYSIMNVRLAAQVLSETVGNVLLQFQNDAEATAQYCLMMDKFFDIVNIKNPKQHTTDIKPALKPFSRMDDDRFHWLKDVFLKYFDNWLESIDNRPGDFTVNARSNMFIAWQTHEGIKITVHSTIELVQYLLSNNVPYVLTERFCQDPLENYFGRQRSMGARKDNPTINDVGYNDNSIRNQKIFRPIAGNVRNADKNEISDEPLPCRKKSKK